MIMDFTEKGNETGFDVDPSSFVPMFRAGRDFDYLLFWARTIII